MPYRIGDVDYDNRKLITIGSAAYSLSASVSTRPIIIKADATADWTDFYASVDNDATIKGGVVAFSTDGTTALEYDNISWDFAGKDSWWKVLATVNATDTSLYIYYNQPAAAVDGSNSTGTYNATTEAQYHLNQDYPQGTFVDATSNARNGTATGTSDAPALVDRARSFDGVNNKVAGVQAAVNACTSAFTFEAIVHPTSASSRLLGFYENNSNRGYIYTNPSGAGILLGTWGGAGTGGLVETGNIGTVGSDLHVIVTTDAGGTVLCANGVETVSAINSNPTLTSTVFSLAALGADYYNSAPSSFLTGNLNAVGIHSTKFTADERIVSYQSALRNWLTIGAEETGGGGGGGTIYNEAISLNKISGLTQSNNKVMAESLVLSSISGLVDQSQLTIDVPITISSIRTLSNSSQATYSTNILSNSVNQMTNSDNIVANNTVIFNTVKGIIGNNGSAILENIGIALKQGLSTSIEWDLTASINNVFGIGTGPISQDILAQFSTTVAMNILSTAAMNVNVPIGLITGITTTADGGVVISVTTPDARTIFVEFSDRTLVVG